MLDPQALLKESFFKEIFSLDISPVIVLDSHYSILEANHSASKICSFTKPVNKINFKEWCHTNKIPDLFPTCLKDLKNHGKCQRYVYHGNKCIEWNIIPFYSKTSISCFVLMGQDRTKEKLLSQQQENTEKKEKEIHSQLAQIAKQVTGYNGNNIGTLEITNLIYHYLDNIIAQLPGSAYWKDKNLVYLGCNNYCASLVGLKSRSDIIGKSDYDIAKLVGYPKSVAESFRHDDASVIETGKGLFNIQEPTFVSVGGREIHQLTTRVPLFDNSKNIIGVLGISIDVTDRIHAEQLEKEKSISEQKIQYLRALGGLIAHELRTPLGAIMLSYDLIEHALTRTAEAVLEKSPKLYEETFEENFGEALRNGENINSVIKKTSMTINLLLSNIKEESIDKSHFLRASITSDIHSVLESYPFVGDELQKIHFKAKDSKDFVYFGNPSLTQLVIINLLKNALYHTKLESKGEIYINVKPGKQKNLLIFHDDGPGIPADLLPKIFDRFVTGRAGGTGLGLAFCKMVIEAYGGSITCDSKEGEYTTFTLTFPTPKK